MKLVTLYRPAGQKELDLVKESGFKRFPPRLEWQPIFYPVINKEYAEQIAKQWNTEDEFSGYAGHVLSFDLPEEFIKKYPVQNVGGDIHNELWVPADELEEFNDNIIGEIRIECSFYGKKNQRSMIDQIKGALFGLAVGVALGVPVEFSSRERLKAFPIKEMTGYGTWKQPPGTWSDDSSLAFCLAEALTNDHDLRIVACYFIAWLKQGYWGAHHKVFDVGNATHAAIMRLIKGVSPELAGGFMEADNGNGSLMRILPLAFYIKDMTIEERFSMVKSVSSITHAHFRSVFACFVYIEMALQILQEPDLRKAYLNVKDLVREFNNNKGFNPEEIALFDRILISNISDVHESDIHADGYVLHTLETSL